MCNRASVTVPGSKIAKALNAPFPEIDSFAPTYDLNGFAHPQMPVLAKGEIRLMNWGLMPNWPTKTLTEQLKHSKFTLNARDNTIFEKPSYKNSIWNKEPDKIKRCVIPLSGFFEPHTYNRVKYPFYIFPKNEELFYVAGIYSFWKEPISQEWYTTFSMVTTSPNRTLSKIHNVPSASDDLRMVVILEKRNIDLWLDPYLPIDGIKELMQPYPVELMCAHSVSRNLYSPKIDTNEPGIFKHVLYEALNNDEELYKGFNLN